MNVRNLFTDDDAVSPVIGVILMVAITVILAAVIGAFVLNIGGSQEAAPQATLSWQSNDSHVAASHQSGETLPGNEIKIKVGSNTGDLTDDVSAGDTIYIEDNGGNINVQDTPFTGTNAPKDQVSIVWNSPSSDKSSIIASYTP